MEKTLSSLITSWICDSLRPISIVEDDGFLNIIQYCINLGGSETCCHRFYPMSYFSNDLF